VFTILDGGNVGINTNNPTYKLDVAGTAGFDSYIYHNNDTNTFILFEDDRFRIQAGGEYLLDLYEGTQDYVKLGDGGDVDINLNDDIFIEGSSGNIGINTTTVPSKLTLVGDQLISGSYKIYSNGYMSGFAGAG